MGFHQRNCGAFTTGARGTSDTGANRVSPLRGISKLKDVADVRNVDTARGNIGLQPVRLRDLSVKRA